jgi:hypothetical protein
MTASGYNTYIPLCTIYRRNHKTRRIADDVNVWVTELYEAMIIIALFGLVD